MSINNPIFTKPKTQICTQQPSDLYEHKPFINESICSKKPIAYVSPIERPISTDKSVQTDSESIDFNSFIDIRDFERSQRMLGALEYRGIVSTSENSEVSLLCSRIKVLQQALDEQRTRNEEVKKLLMVSLGNDLASHFTQLMSDLSSTGARVSSLIFEKEEINCNVDQLSIEADLWKKKFVAGRILVNELGCWKQQFSLRYQESLDAIHDLLQERQSIRVKLSHLNDELLQISSHLGLSHTNKYCSNTIDLVKQSLDMAKELSHIVSSSSSRIISGTGNYKSKKQITEFTSGEESAIEVLMNRPSMSEGNSNRYIGSFSAREHNDMEHMVLSICRHCRGEILVV